MDDLLRPVFSKLLQSGTELTSGRGKNVEIRGVLLELTNPRARLSRSEAKGTLFSCLGELLWYLSGSDDLQFIRYYLPGYPDDTTDGHTVPDAYGPRLIGTQGYPSQIENIIDMLRDRPRTRRAVITILDAFDIDQQLKAVPCTSSLQFFVRDDRLEMFASLRSNDAYIGFPHDVFAFTMMQEIIARSVGVELGTYKHAIGSLHLYHERRADAQRYIREGWQSSTEMPVMPPGDPWPALRQLLDAERQLRLGESLTVAESALDPYWADLLRLLRAYSHIRTASDLGGDRDLLNRRAAELREISRLRRQMASRVYEIYIRQRESTLARKHPQT